MYHIYLKSLFRTVSFDLSSKSFKNLMCHTKPLTYHPARYNSQSPNEYGTPVQSTHSLIIHAFDCCRRQIRV